MIWRILHGDVREQLRSLEAGSVQTCVTSPPYWGLRDYCVPGQLGLEPTPDAYVAAMVDVFREVRRVLRDDGTCWINLGDSYASGEIGRHDSRTQQQENFGARMDGPRQQARLRSGCKPKDLVGIPWRVAFALQADGWYLRSDIIWSKPNPMPESVTDRPTKAHEYIFLLSKSARYYYDADAVREPLTDSTIERVRYGLTTNKVNVGNCLARGVPVVSEFEQMGERFAPEGGRNKRSVWHVATQPYPEAHFATFPEALIEPCILAGAPVGGVVLDPFTGSGTTGAVAIRHQRQFVGVELNPEYITLARKRIGAVAPLFAQEHTA